MTPQHIFVSINLQVISDGEFWRLWLMGLNGQNSYCCGRTNNNIDMRMAGVAEPTDTFDSCCVVVMK